MLVVFVDHQAERAAVAREQVWRGLAGTAGSAGLAGSSGTVLLRLPNGIAWAVTARSLLSLRMGVCASCSASVAAVVIVGALLFQRPFASCAVCQWRLQL